MAPLDIKKATWHKAAIPRARHNRSALYIRPISCISSPALSFPDANSLARAGCDCRKMLLACECDAYIYIYISDVQCIERRQVGRYRRRESDTRETTGYLYTLIRERLRLCCNHWFLLPKSYHKKLRAKFFFFISLSLPRACFVLILFCLAFLGYVYTRVARVLRGEYI